MLNYLLGPILQLLPENNRLERIWKLALIDFKKRYYNTYLGVVWAFLNPLFKLFIYYTIFSIVIDPQIENYGFYIFSGIIFWQFFSEGTNKSFSILKSKRYLLENIQFNKVDLYYSAILSLCLGFIFNLTSYLLITSLFGIYFNWNLLWIFFLALNTALIVFGFLLILSTFYIHFSDLNQIWSMVLLAGIWLTPIFYGRSALIEAFPALLYINPLAGIIINVRETSLYARSPDFFLLGYDFAWGVVISIVGLIIFKRFSKKMLEKL